MRELGPATEGEVVLAFLKAEIDSPRFGPMYAAILHTSGLSRAMLIDNAALANAEYNRLRAELLKAVRGYRAGLYLFKGFPGDVRWRRVELLPGDVGKLRYANYPTWTALSNGSRVVADGAANIDRIQTTENVNASIKTVAAAVTAGERYAELIAVQAHEGSLILVEGHTRATAYVLARIAEPVHCFVGSSPTMRAWAFY